MKFAEAVALAAHELAFWKQFVQTERFLKGWAGGKTITPELHPEIRDYILERDFSSGAQVLDVGSGACSILHGLVPVGCLVSSDPLSPLYRLIFDYAAHGVQIPYPIAAEDLPQDWTGQFDVVHISNALDHSQFPELAMMRLWECTRKGGALIVAGFEREADYQHCTGMHRWNIYLKGKELKIENGTTKQIELCEWTATHAIQKKLPTGKNWFIWRKEKE